MTAPRLTAAGAFLAAFLLFTVIACDGRHASQPYSKTFLAFGTTVRVEIVGTDTGTAAAAALDIENFFSSVNADWYAWGDGELTRVNAALSRGETVVLSDTLLPLIANAIGFHERSRGLFDPAVGGLVELWGFDSMEHLRAVSSPPATDTIERTLERNGTTGDLRLDGNRLRSLKPVQLDLGGVAKGAALEHCRRILAARGIANALVDIGGSSLLAVGHRGDRPWRIALKDPRATPVLGVLELEDGEAVSTSGDYERFFDTAEGRRHHVIDPRTGVPAAAVAGVTVISRDGELADVASTALMVAGPAAFDELVSALGLEQAVLITVQGELIATPAMRARLLRANGGELPEPARPDGI